MNSANAVTSNVLDEMFTLADFEAAAPRRMSSMAWEYLSSGAADETTLRWNRESFDKIKLNPRVLKDVSSLDTRVGVFGQTLAFPIILAPVGLQRLYHPDGEIAAVKGAAQANATYLISSYSTTPLEDIASATDGQKWMQIYLQPDREFTRDVVQRAEAGGVKAFCVTVDLPVIGVRNRMDRARFAVPPEMSCPHMMENFTGSPITWADVEWLRSITKLPVILKGILNPDDAELAVKNGLDGIIVSNHGARDLDTTPATIEALPRVAERVDDRITVLMDGGIRRGTDVLKALALGAKAVLIGRPFCFGLAAGGADGVAKVTDILRCEFEKAMALTGRTSIASIDGSVIWTD
ncbi:MAG: alpha-hydroxy-acid oxidizing protein [Acidobacteria bacterium]|nr:alpha-hydroxy-acid oxidizing protein [Acidobacteriota bacterium]